MCVERATLNVALGATLLLAVACGAPPAPSAVAPAATVATTPSAPSPVPRASTDAGPPQAGPPDDAGPSVASPSAPFPPADIPPLQERSAQPGDGRWVRLGAAAAGDRLGTGEPLMFRTVVHPHPISKWQSVTLVAIDLSRVALHLVAGTDDPKDPSAPAELRTGLVPEEHRDSLLAVFNGGWKTAHGHWGVRVGGHDFVPPKQDGCTLALTKDGQVRLASWPALEPLSASLVALRQTPPCLLEEGALHPELGAGRERAWGGQSPKLKTRQRSAVGLDANGTILFYAYGEEVGARLLAEGLRAAGAKAAAELDINFIWVRFLLFGQKAAGGRLEVTSTLIPKMAHEKRGYVERPAARDFFYLRRR